MIYHLLLTSEDQTTDLASQMGRTLERGSVILLTGELGAGKTCFVRGLAQGLGHDSSRIASPTYVMVHEYETPGCTSLIHVDAYRIGSQDSLEDASISSDETREAIVAVEWADRLHGAAWDETKAVQLSISHSAHPSGTHRDITIDVPDAMTNLRAFLKNSTRQQSETQSTENVALRHSCPICNGPVQPDATTLPFCSQRCKLADLGNWFRGSYAISRELKPEDFDELE